MRAFQVTATAYDDADRAAAHLEAARKGYGAKFTAALRQALSVIRVNPQQYPIAEDAPDGVEVRELFIAKYDYRVIFRVTDDSTVVIAVFHTARRPGAWHRRLPEPPA